MQPLVETPMLVGRALTIKHLAALVVRTRKLVERAKVLMDPRLMVRQLLAARVHLPAPIHQTLPLKSQSLLLVKLLVSLQRQWVGQDGCATGEVTTELDSY